MTERQERTRLIAQRRSQICLGTRGPGTPADELLLPELYLRQDAPRITAGILEALQAVE
jgi:hypothetical protein